MEIGNGDATAKRCLRLALVANDGPQELARQVRKRLREIARSGSFNDSTGRKALVADLDTQRRIVVGDIDAHPRLMPSN